MKLPAILSELVMEDASPARIGEHEPHVLLSPESTTPGHKRYVKNDTRVVSRRIPPRQRADLQESVSRVYARDAPVWTAIPATFSPMSSHSPVWS
jgi:hypothetical protein